MLHSLTALLLILRSCSATTDSWRERMTANTTPNILLVVIDDLPFLSQWSESAPAGTDLEQYTVSYDSYPTTQIDAFRAESVIFPYSFCGGPKCAPSRVSILTGRYPSRMAWVVEQTVRSTGALEEGPDVTVINSKLSGYDSTFNLPTTLQSHGYHTGMVGKWHIMPGDDNGYGYGCESLEGTPDTELYGKCTDIVKLQGFDFVDAWYYGNIVSSQYFSHNPEWMVSQSQQFIEEAVALDKPFFLYFASTLAHSPDVYEALTIHSAIESSKGTLIGDEMPNVTRIGMPSRDEIWDEARLFLKDEAGESLAKKTKYASYLWLDAMFGALVTYLKDHGLYDGTMVILQSDHGEEGKGLLYQQGTRILNFVKYPASFGYGVGVVLPQQFVVSNVDLAATIFDLVDITKSADYVIDGISWLDEADELIMDGVNSAATCCTNRKIDIQNSHSIVTAQFQYIWRANGLVDTAKDVDTLYPNTHDLEQLYDLYVDPNQKRNLIAWTNHSVVISEFQQMMREYVADICAPELGECLKPTLSFCSYVDTATFSWVLSSRKKKLTDAIRNEKLNEAKTFVARDLPNCTINTSNLDFTYKFTFRRPDLSLDVEVCCGDAGAVFGSDYTPSEGFESASEFSDAYTVGDESDADSFDVIKAVIVAGIIVIVLCFVCVVVVMAWCRYTSKKRKAREMAKLEVTVDYIKSHVDMTAVMPATIEEAAPKPYVQEDGHIIYTEDDTQKTPINTPTPSPHKIESGPHTTMSKELNVD